MTVTVENELLVMTKQIDEFLTTSESQLLLDAVSNKEDREALKEQILKNKDLHKFVSYDKIQKNIDEIMAELVGKGVIETLVKSFDDITDIGYVGNTNRLAVRTVRRNFIYEDDRISPEYMLKIIRRFVLCDTSNAKFDHGTPFYNGFSDNMRISANHDSISGGAVSFAIRISRPYLVLTDDNFSNTAPMFIREFLRHAVVSECNMFICGMTGSGKTELQKLMITDISFSRKIYLIMDVAEIDATAIYKDQNIVIAMTSKEATIAKHIEQALRFDPSWILPAEIRGAEAYSSLHAIRSGHRMMVTLHAENNNEVKTRISSMIREEYSIDELVIQESVGRLTHLSIHCVGHEINNRTYRYIDEISAFLDNGDVVPIFQQRYFQKDDKIYKVYSTYELPKKIADKFDGAGIKFELPNITQQVEFVETVVDVDPIVQSVNLSDNKVSDGGVIDG